MRWNHNPYALMAVLLLLWGSFAAVGKWALQGLESWQMQFWMFAAAMIAMLLMLPFGGRFRQLARTGKREALQLSLIGFVSYLYYVCYTTALKYIPATEASILNYLFPITVVLFAMWLGKERITLSKTMLILAGLAGTWIIISKGNLSDFRLTNIWGDLLAIAGAVFWGLFSNLGKRSESSLFVSVFMYVAVSFVSSLLSLFFFSQWAVPELGVLAGIGWLSMSNVVWCYFIWFRALKVSSAALIAGLSFITPFVTLVFIVIVLGETISLTQFAGFALILAGVFAHQRMSGKHERREGADHAIQSKSS